MTNDKVFLAFDCGATSGRAVLARFSQGKFSTEEVYRFPNSIMEAGGKYYWNVFSIYGHFLACLSDLAGKGIRPDSIGIDTWGVDFGFIGADGTVLSLPRAYRDPYTSGVPSRVFEKVPSDELYGVTGIQVMDFNTIFQLYAQKEEGFSPLEAAGRILFMPDLLSYMLTGKMVCEYTDASTSGMMDQRSRQFAGGIMDRLGIDAGKFLPVADPGFTVGTLRKEIADATGIGEIPVVAVAGHDTASAVAAVPAADANFAYLSSGTWSLMGIETPSPIMTSRAREFNFTNEGGIDGTTRFLKNITGMWLLEQCRAVWKAEGKDYGYPALVAMAQAEKDFAGRIAPDDPRFAAPGDMVCEITAAAGLGALTDAQIVSCIYHSLADRYAEVLDMLKGFAPFPIDKLHVIGGGSANGLLNQWTADRLGIPVVAGPVEATAIGNVIMQARAAGLVNDRWQMRRMIADAVEVKVFNPNG